MPYLMTPAHRAQITALSAPERHFHFIDKVVEHKTLWTLMKDDEPLIFSDDNSRISIPVWPHPDYAQALATGDWSNASLVRIDLDPFLSHTLPSCIKDNVHFLVFPISEKKGAIVTAKDLQQELTEALEDAKNKKPRTLEDIPELPDDFIAQP